MQSWIENIEEIYNMILTVTILIMGLKIKKNEKVYS